MKYNPQIHHRRSIRLKGYDYSQAGLYFITLCVQHRACLFGHIRNGEPTCPPEMILNDAGKMVEKWYYELENKFPDIKCDAMIVMPNHFHCIVENVGTSAVGADLRVCPEIETGEPILDNPISDEHAVGADLRVCPEIETGEHIGSPQQGSPQQGSSQRGSSQRGSSQQRSPLHRVVQWFKTMTTNEYIRGVKNLGWKPFDGKLWQRNYYEHIIRNEKSYKTISEYILNNPAKWHDDKFYQ